MKTSNALRGLVAGASMAVLLMLVIGLAFGTWPALAGNWAAILRRQASPASPAQPNSAAQFGSDTLLHIPAAAFQPDGFDPGSFRFTFTGGPTFGGGYLQGTARNYGCLSAPAYLPDGVSISEMSAYVYDNDNTRSVDIVLRRVNLTTGLVEDIAALNTSQAGASGSIQNISTTNINHADISSSQYGYYVASCLPSTNTMLFAVDLTYNSDIAVTKSIVPGLLLPGTTNFAYKIDVTSSGSVQPTSVTLEDTLPPEVTFLNVTSTIGSCSHVSDTIFCNLGIFSGNASASVTINVSIPADFRGVLTNQADITTVPIDYDPDTNSFTHIAVIGEPVFLPVIFVND